MRAKLGNGTAWILRAIEALRQVFSENSQTVRPGDNA